MKKASKVLIIISIIMALIGIAACLYLTIGASIGLTDASGEHLTRLYIPEIVGLLFPVIFGFLGLKKLKNAKSKTEITGMAICVLIFCNLIAGILMLFINEEDLKV